MEAPHAKLWRTRPFSADPWLDLPPPHAEPYPFEGFEPLEREVLRLSSMLNPLRNPGGTTVLVTGERGAGKTSLVNAAIFHASLLARFEDGWIKKPGGLLDEESWNTWALTEWLATNPLPDVRRMSLWSDDVDLKKLTASARERRARAMSARSERLKGFQALILLDVHVPFPEAHLEQRQILSRTLRRLYFRLVNAGLADANPQFVRNARLAYFRSIATSTNLLEKEKYVACFKPALGKGEIGLAASLELELAWELAVELERSNEAEMGDDLQLLLEDLARLRLGGEGILRRAMRALTGMFDGTKDFFLGTEQLRIHPIIVFDELDKAQPASHPSPEADRTPDSKLEANKARYLAWVVGTLKTVLTAHGATFVFIAGPEHAQRWSSLDHSEQLDAELLRSVFSDRFHVRRLDLEKVRKIVEQYVILPPNGSLVSVDTLARALHYVSGGLMRSIIRLLREAQLKLQGPERTTRRFGAGHLVEVLTGSFDDPDGRATEVAALAKYQQIVVVARDQLVGEVRALELPSAATRVAGKIFALEDAMWGAAQRTLEQLRTLARRQNAALAARTTNAAEAISPSHGPSESTDRGINPDSAVPSLIEQVIHTLIHDGVAAEASRWLVQAGMERYPGQQLVVNAGAFSIMIEKVLDAIESVDGTLLDMNVSILRQGLRRKAAETTELAP